MLRGRVNELITVLERQRERERAEERNRAKSHGKQTEKAKRRKGVTEDGNNPEK